MAQVQRVRGVTFFQRFKTPFADNSADEQARFQPRARMVGELLQERREEIGLDLDEIGAMLRIKPAYLAALEQGRTHDLPGPTYAIGFVRAYAEFLGLEASPVLERFKAEAAGVTARPDLALPVPLGERSVPGGALVLVALIVALCGYGVWYYLSTEDRGRPERVAAVPAALKPPAPASTLVAPPLSPPVPASPVSGEASPPAAAPSLFGAAAGPGLASPPSPPAAPLPNTAPNPTPAPQAAAMPPPGSAGAPTAATGNLSTGALLTKMPSAAGPSPPPRPPAPSPQEATAPAPSPTPVGTAPAAPAQPQTAAVLPPAPAANAPAAAPTQGRVAIRATADCWIQVKAPDQSILFSRVLKAGEI